MITVDFYFALSALLGVALALALGAWIALPEQKSKELSLDKKYIWYCSVCTYTYINTKEDTFSTCPRCASVNKR